MKKKFDFYDKTSLKSYNLDKTMQYQLNMLNDLDVFTRKHCENVASITCRLCEYMHFSKAFTAYCTICAYMHDIGKLFIPPEILQKPSKLTPEEFEVMKTHTTIGYKMCMGDLKLRPYAAGPYYHHEALDGSGYPQGLKKKDIPIEAQIIRVADEYDAIVSKRQYKSHIDISETLEILINNTKPHNPADNSDEIIYDIKFGRDNRKVVKQLIKVVLDDIAFEIESKKDYISSLDIELQRLNQIEKYHQKMENAKKEKDKNYYLEGMKILFKQGETVENHRQVAKEIQDAYDFRKSEIDHLHEETKKIKKMRV